MLPTHEFKGGQAYTLDKYDEIFIFTCKLLSLSLHKEIKTQTSTEGFNIIFYCFYLFLGLFLCT